MPKKQVRKYKTELKKAEKRVRKTPKVAVRRTVRRTVPVPVRKANMRLISSRTRVTMRKISLPKNVNDWIREFRKKDKHANQIGRLLGYYYKQNRRTFNKIWT